MNDDYSYEKVLGTLVQVTYPDSSKHILPITYVGKYGFTIGTGTDIWLRCLFTSNTIENKYIKFHAHTLRPDGTPCKSLEEVQKYYPEYFI